MSRFEARGRHCLADLFGVSAPLLADRAALETILRNAAAAATAQVLFARFHSFGEGLGVTGVVLLAESHISIHSWPEARFAAVDIFMCGQADTDLALQALVAELAPTRIEAQNITRGLAPASRVGPAAQAAPDPSLDGGARHG